MNFVLKRVTQRITGANPQLIRQLAVDLLREGMASFTAESLAAVIISGEVPKDFIATTVAHIHKHRELWSVDKDEFLRAAHIARPDLAPLLLTHSGDAWLEKAMWQLGKDLVANPILGAFKEVLRL